jgi:hypothetical protein
MGWWREFWRVVERELPPVGLAFRRNESGRGQPHSKTLSRRIARHSFREVLECGCPLPL